MNRYVAGVLAGLAATLVLAIIVLVMQLLGLLPQLEMITTLAIAMSVNMTTAWFAHFSIGSIWGAIYAVVEPRLPGISWVRGVVFSLFPWLAMMLGLFPLADQGLFGLGRGIGMPVITLLLHLVFGGFLGAIYGALPRRAGTAPHDRQARAR